MAATNGAASVEDRPSAVPPPTGRAAGDIPGGVGAVAIPPLCPGAMVVEGLEATTARMPGGPDSSVRGDKVEESEIGATAPAEECPLPPAHGGAVAAGGGEQAAHFWDDCDDIATVDNSTAPRCKQVSLRSFTISFSA